MRVSFDFKNGREMGELVKRNSKTVWVSLPVPAGLGKRKMETIKRHIKKHNVKILEK